MFSQLPPPSAAVVTIATAAAAGGVVTAQHCGRGGLIYINRRWAWVGAEIVYRAAATAAAAAAAAAATVATLIPLLTNGEAKVRHEKTIRKRTEMSRLK